MGRKQRRPINVDHPPSKEWFTHAIQKNPTIKISESRAQKTAGIHGRIIA
jgi:hypothetical protein